MIKRAKFYKKWFRQWPLLASLLVHVALATAMGWQLSGAPSPRATGQHLQATLVYAQGDVQGGVQAEGEDTLVAAKPENAAESAAPSSDKIVQPSRSLDKLASVSKPKVVAAQKTDLKVNSKLSLKQDSSSISSPSPSKPNPSKANLAQRQMAGQHLAKQVVKEQPKASPERQLNEKQPAAMLAAAKPAQPRVDSVITPSNSGPRKAPSQQAIAQSTFAHLADTDADTESNVARVLPAPSQSPSQGSAVEFAATSIKVKNMQPPTYPHYAILRRQSGTAVVAILLSADGAVKRSIIHHSSDHRLLDKAVLQAAKRWQFVPPVPAAQVLVPVKFELECLGSACKPKRIVQG